MKASEAIAQLDAIKANQYAEEDKLSWLYNLDASLYLTVVSWHVNEETIPEAPYTADTDLLVSEPFTSLYIRYMEMMVDYHNAEFERYNSDMVMYNADLAEFTAYYNRTHMPLQSNHAKGAKV